MKILRLKTANVINTKTINTNPETPRIRGGKLKKIREHIMIRDNVTCQKCNRVTMHGEVDHIIPLHLGGSETNNNRQYLCKSCHEIKTNEEKEKRENKNG